MTSGAKASTSSRFNHVAEHLNALQLGQRNAAEAAEAATKEMGLRLWRTQAGDDVVLASVMPGSGKPVLVVKPDGTVVRGTADIILRTPPDLQNALDLGAIVEDAPIFPKSRL